MAQYFESKPLYFDDEHARPNQRKCFELPWQQMRAGYLEKALITMCDLWYINARIFSGQFLSLQIDIEEISTKSKSFFNSSFEISKEEGRKKIECEFVQDIIDYANGKSLKWPILSNENIAHGKNDQVAVSFQGINPESWIKFKQMSHFLNTEGTKLFLTRDFKYAAILLGIQNSIDGQSGIYDADIVHKAEINSDLLFVEKFTSNTSDQKQLLIREFMLSVNEDEEDFINSIVTSKDSVIKTTLDFQFVNVVLPTNRVHYFERQKEFRKFSMAYITAIEVSIDGRIVVSGHESGAIGIWNLETMKLVNYFEYNLSGIVDMALTPNGKSLIVGDQKGEILCLDILKGEVYFKANGHEGAVVSVAISHLADTAVTVGADGILRFWNLRKSECDEIIHIDEARISKLAYFSEFNLLVTGDTNGEIRSWNKGNATYEIWDNVHSNFISSIAFSWDGLYMASGDSSGCICIWDIPLKKFKVKIQAHKNEIRDLKFTPGYPHLYSSSYDSVRIWDIFRDLNSEIFSIGDNFISAVSFWKKKNTGILANFDSISLVDFATKRILQKLEAENRGLSSETFQFLRLGEEHARNMEVRYSHKKILVFPNRKWILSWTDGWVGKVYDVESGSIISVMIGHTSDIRAVCISQTGKIIFTTGWDNTIKVWDAATGKCLQTLDGVKNNDFNAVIFSPDDRILCLNTEDGTYFIDLIDSLIHFAYPNASVKLMPDSTTVFVISNGHLNVWNLYTGEKLLSIPEKFSDASKFIVSSDCKKVVVWYDKILWLYDLERMVISWQSKFSLCGDRFYEPVHFISGDSNLVVFDDREVVRVLSVQTGIVESVYSCDDIISAVTIEDEHILLGTFGGGYRVLERSKQEVSIQKYATITRFWNHFLKAWEREYKACCSSCGHINAVSENHLHVISALYVKYAVDLQNSPIYKLPSSAWKMKELETKCAQCFVAFRYNPFVVDNS